MFHSNIVDETNGLKEIYEEYLNAGFGSKATTGADAILSVALTATSGISVQFRGICGNGVVGGTSDSYLYVDFINLNPV